MRGSSFRGGDDARQFAAPALGKGNLTVLEGKKGVVAADAHVLAGMNPGSPLTHNDGSGFYLRSAGRLNTQVLGIGIPSVFGAAAAPFPSHSSSSVRQFVYMFIVQ